MIDFSIIILVKNEEKTIAQVIKSLIRYSNAFSVEFLIIDSGSTDKTASIIKHFQKKYRNVKYFKIKQKGFHFAETRNKAVLQSKGKYILFISGDAIPITKNCLSYFKEDLEIDNKTIAVFGKHVPPNSCKDIQSLETVCKFQKLDKYTNSKGIFIQNKNSMEIDNNKNPVLFYSLSNVFSCYKRNFLIDYPFTKVVINGQELKGKEDIYLGQKIINLGFSKIYDKRCKVIHSNQLSIAEYYRRQREEFNLYSSVFKFKINNNVRCKIISIFKMDVSLWKKLYLLINLIFYYLIKVSTVLEIYFFRIKTTINSHYHNAN